MSTTERNLYTEPYAVKHEKTYFEAC